MKTLIEKFQEIATTFNLPFNTVSRAYDMIKLGKALPEIRKCESIPLNHNSYNHLFHLYIQRTAIKKPQIMVSPVKEPYYNNEKQMEVENYSFEALSETEKQIYLEL